MHSLSPKYKSLRREWFTYHQHEGQPLSPQIHEWNSFHPKRIDQLRYDSCMVQAGNGKVFETEDRDIHLVRLNSMSATKPNEKRA